MRLKLRRPTAEAERVNVPRRASWLLPTGTVLGWFVESRLRFEVRLAAERQLWLRSRPETRPDHAPVDAGPVVWDDYRSPHMAPMPEWLDSSAFSTTVIVLKSTALHRAVVHGEALDPALGIEINAQLGELFCESSSASQIC